MTTGQLPPLPSGPTAQQNPALIANAMSKLITYIGDIMLKRINDPTYLAPEGLLLDIRLATLAMGAWSMSLTGVIAASCDIVDGDPDGPKIVVLNMIVYGRQWQYTIYDNRYVDTSDSLSS